MLHNADFDQRLSTFSGPPTPDDLDELLSMRRKTSCLPAWRGVPLLPCGNIPISKQGTSSIIAMRTGEDDQA